MVMHKEWYSNVENMDHDMETANNVWVDLYEHFLVCGKPRAAWLSPAQNSSARISRGLS